MSYPRLISFSAATVIAAVELLLLTPPAHGRSPIVVSAPAAVVTRHVSYADLNLASVDGEKRLEHRVSFAIYDLCDEATGGRNGTMTVNLSIGQCGRTAWSQARPQIVRAVARAYEIVRTGTSNLAATAVAITLPE
jgi:UrcA family protein